MTPKTPEQPNERESGTPESVPSMPTISPSQPARLDPETFDKSVIDLIEAGKWEDVLVQLTSDMDPWDIDLIRLSRRFTSYVKEFGKLDLRVPSKIMLTAAIIHRMKAETLAQVEPLEMPEEEFDAKAPHPLKGVAIPPLQLPLKREPKRKVSLFELIAALDKAFTIKDKREARRVFEIDLHGVIGGKDISAHIDELYEKILKILESAGKVVTFSHLVGSAAGRDSRLTSFASLLHLVHQEKIAAWQRRLFDEIYITKVNGTPLEELKKQTGVEKEEKEVTEEE